MAKKYSVRVPFISRHWPFVTASSMLAKLVLSAIIGIFVQWPISVSGLSAEGQLMEDLLLNYSKYTRPTLSVASPTVVTLEFGLRKIGSLDEQGQVLTTSGFIISYWFDPFLTWDPDKYDGASHLIIPGDRIWLPEIAVYNSAEGISDISLVDASRFRVDISSKGIVTWIPGGQWKTECQVNLVAFPFDKQKCDVIFTNWVHKTSIMYAMHSHGSVRLDGYSPNSEWMLLNATSAVTIRTYSADEKYVFELPTASFTVELRRSSGYYVLNVLVPTLTLSLISVLMFWLPPECGERVSFGITVLLSFSFIMLMMSDVTPKSGSGMPLLLYYVVTCMLVSGMSLCLSVFILHISIRVSINPPSARFRSIVFDYLARIVCSRPDRPSAFRKPVAKNEVAPVVLADESFEVDEKDVDTAAMKTKSKKSSSLERLLRRVETKLDDDRANAKNKEEWLKICQVLDHCLFVLMTIVEIIFTVVLLVYMAVLARS